MGRRLRKAGVVFAAGLAVLLAAAQLIRPERTNPPTEASRTIEASAGISPLLVTVLDRSCNDCHSNGTVWSRYTRIAPVSWLVNYSVKSGRKALNFSEWAGYTPRQQHDLLTASCRDASQGKMPGSVYTMLRPEARLSATDISAICVAASGTGMSASTASRGP